MSIRIVDLHSGRWFAAVDIAAAMGIKVDSLLRGIDDDAKDTSRAEPIISSRGLSAVLLRAGRRARPFRGWVAKNLRTGPQGEKRPAAPQRQQHRSRPPEPAEPAATPTEPIPLFGPLITLTEIAQRIGMSRQWLALHIDELQRERDFPPRIVGFNRWLESSIVEWISRQAPRPVLGHHRAKPRPLPPSGKLLSEAETARRLGMSPRGFRRHLDLLERREGFPRALPGFRIAGPSAPLPIGSRIRCRVSTDRHRRRTMATAGPSNSTGVPRNWTWTGCRKG